MPQEPKRTYRLSQVVRHGMPINVTCNGPARFFAVPEFTAMTPQDRDLTAISGNGYKAPARVREAELTAAGTLTVRPRFNKFRDQDHAPLPQDQDQDRSRHAARGRLLLERAARLEPAR